MGIEVFLGCFSCFGFALYLLCCGKHPLYIGLRPVLAGTSIVFFTSGGICECADDVLFEFFGYNTGDFKNTFPNANFGAKP